VKVQGWGSHTPKGLGDNKRELMGGVWFVKMGGGISGRCVVCMGDGVETKSMVSKWAMGKMEFDGT
jgi:hypothetical protein